MNKKEKDAAKRIAVQFLVNWKKKNPEEMFGVSQKTWQYNHHDGIEWIKDKLINIIDIQSFKLIKVSPMTECMIDITAKIRTNSNAKHKTVINIKMRLIKEKAAYEPSEDGEWGVNPISTVRKI